MSASQNIVVNNSNGVSIIIGEKSPRNEILKFITDTFTNYYGYSVERFDDTPENEDIAFGSVEDFIEF